MWIITELIQEGNIVVKSDLNTFLLYWNQLFYSNLFWHTFHTTQTLFFFKSNQFKNIVYFSKSLWIQHLLYYIYLIFLLENRLPWSINNWKNMITHLIFFYHLPRLIYHGAMESTMQRRKNNWKEVHRLGNICSCVSLFVHHWATYGQSKSDL